jgi:hypothetical protein
VGVSSKPIQCFIASFVHIYICTYTQVVAMEAAGGQRGEWGFKALKQSVKLLFDLGRHEVRPKNKKQKWSLVTCLFFCFIGG